MSNFAVVQNGQVVQIVPLDVMFTVGSFMAPALTISITGYLVQAIV